MIMHLGALMIVSAALIYLIFAKRFLEDSQEVQDKVVQDTSVSRFSKISVSKRIRLYDTLIQLLALITFILGIFTLIQTYHFMFKQ